jgi:hypothetical protein
MRLEVLKAVKKSIAVFWVVTPCGLVEGFRRLRGNLKMEKIRTYETLVAIYKSTWLHNPEHLKSQTLSGSDNY